MGGRGASSPSDILANGKYPKFQNNALGPNVPKDLKTALGVKGEPMSMRAAYSGANPHFSRDYAEYSFNCQRAVIAYEARRRGYDVTALPTYKGDILPRSTKNGNAFWMGAFQGAKPVSVGAKTRKEVQSNLASKMQSWGDGSRAIVRVGWKNSRSGHVFNVENHNGKMYYVDAQTGSRVNIKQYLGLADPSSVRLVRTDNLRFSDRARKSVTSSNR